MSDSMTGPSLAFIGRKRGRPRSLESKSALTAWVPTTYHDRISQLALKHDVSVSKVVCVLLADALKSKHS